MIDFLDPQIMSLAMYAVAAFVMYVVYAVMNRDKGDR